MTKDNILYYRKSDHIKGKTINFIYYGDDGQFYYSHLLFDSVQYEIFDNSENKEDIILKGIEKGKCFQTENITNQINLDTIKTFDILEKVRDIKINKIIN